MVSLAVLDACDSVLVRVRVRVGMQLDAHFVTGKHLLASVKSCRIKGLNVGIVAAIRYAPGSTIVQLVVVIER